MRFTRHDLADLTAILRAAARSEVMPRFRNLPRGAVRAKTGPLDLVTEADEAAERAIAAALARRFPAAAVVGEEAAAADGSVLRRLEGAELAFVVDPIDGTANFAAGMPLFAVMAAAISQGEVIASAIHDPVGDDTALALRGEGAWLERADGSVAGLRVAKALPMGEMMGMASWRFLPEAQRRVVAGNLAATAGAWDCRCAAHQYRLAAAGHLHFLLYYRLYPWDHAPGWLLHREAGGYAARFDGSGYDPLDTGGGLICAPDRAAWQELRENLFSET
jgi:fructose-1,6-bisphosphatase/inositol monophosphatase family enzyme